MTKKKSGIPKPLFSEAQTEYRLRVVTWLLERKPQGVDSLVYDFTQETGTITSKELMVNALTVLQKRGIVKRSRDGQDRRRTTWSLV